MKVIVGHYSCGSALCTFSLNTLLAFFFYAKHELWWSCWRFIVIYCLLWFTVLHSSSLVLCSLLFHLHFKYPNFKGILININKKNLVFSEIRASYLKQDFFPPWWLVSAVEFKTSNFLLFTAMHLHFDFRCYLIVRFIICFYTLLHTVAHCCIQLYTVPHCCLLLHNVAYS